MNRFYLLISFVALLSACDNENDNIDSFISTDIEFMPIERYENSSLSNIAETPSLKLRINTTQRYHCGNYRILTSQSVSDNELTIKFEEIQEPILCLLNGGPATSYIDIPEDINKLVFINGEIIDAYNIEIDNEVVSISVIINNFTSSLYSKTFRYPENTFAYVGGTNTDNTHIHDDFLNILINNPLFTEYEFDGEGRIPYQVISDGHWVNMPSRFFKYNNVSDFDVAGQLLIDFATENIIPNDGVSFSLTNWNNRTYYSWQFD
ncbi:hypothetical protein [Maribacter arenosus]|uniref:DUF4842 domain-containing protein n=1 Tax=Maribacter arenosus TaxID=1854708 RepID=A0ABR7VGG8_9FLAO|nr:hypothetical protein [Maribacter arenosus]MBD0851970.1 hypothetical protein [Maribacter arenosus]